MTKQVDRMPKGFGNRGQAERERERERTLKTD